MRKNMFIYKINEFNIVYLKNFYINSYFYFYESNNTLKKITKIDFIKNKYELIPVGFKKMINLYFNLYLYLYTNIYYKKITKKNYIK